MAFFETLGFTFNPQFTDDNAACMVISEHNYAMLLTHACLLAVGQTIVLPRISSVEARPPQLIIQAMQ